jgi:hypothetical protein
MKLADPMLKTSAVLENLKMILSTVGWEKRKQLAERFGRKSVVALARATRSGKKAGCGHGSSPTSLQPQIA